LTQALNRQRSGGTSAVDLARVLRTDYSSDIAELVEAAMAEATAHLAAQAEAERELVRRTMEAMRAALNESMQQAAANIAAQIGAMAIEQVSARPKDEVHHHPVIEVRERVIREQPAEPLVSLEVVRDEDGLIRDIVTNKGTWRTERDEKDRLTGLVDVDP
jgi:hypothetical protein